MNKLKEAAQDILEAVEGIGFVSDYWDEKVIALRTALAEQADEEPVAEVHNTDTPSNWSIIKPGLAAGTKLYAAPVRTKDLTDDEIADVRKSLGNGVMGAVDFARAVIAADREKNNV